MIQPVRPAKSLRSVDEPTPRGRQCCRVDDLVVGVDRVGAVEPTKIARRLTGQLLFADPVRLREYSLVPRPGLIPSCLAEAGEVLDDRAEVDLGICPVVGVTLRRSPLQRSLTQVVCLAQVARAVAALELQEGEREVRRDGRFEILVCAAERPLRLA